MQQRAEGHELHVPVKMQIQMHHKPARNFSISNKVWISTGLMMIWFAVFASATSPYSQTSPQAQSEKIKALRARIVELTQKRETEESYQETRGNLEQIQATCSENAQELRDIRVAINNVLLQFEDMMFHEAVPMYVAKRWGHLDFRRFEVLFKQICDESSHIPCDTDAMDTVETEFNTLVDILVFDSNEEVRAQVMDEAAERQLQNIEEQWGSEMRTLVFEAITELEEYARAHPDLNFRMRNSFYTPYNTGSNEQASYEDAARYVRAVVKAVVGFSNECVCSRHYYQNDDPMLPEDDDPMPPLEDNDPMPPLEDEVVPEDDYYDDDLNWESTRVDDEIYQNPEAVYHQHHGYG